MSQEYPQHEKLKSQTALPREDVLAQFLDFLRSKDIHFGKYPDECESYDECDDLDSDECSQEVRLTDHFSNYDGSEHYHSPRDYMYPVGSETEFSKWIAEFYGVDYKAFNDEKEAMFRSIQEAANKR